MICKRRLAVSNYLSSIKKVVGIILFLFSCVASAQEKPVRVRPEYDRQEEIIDDGKRYRIHNNYLTIGGGVLNSSIRGQSQNNLGIDFQFHIRRQNFQSGVMMSGPAFGSNNNIQAHVGYGYRRERSKNNLAAYIGPSYHWGVEGVAGTPEIFYNEFGVYGTVQVVHKFLYDIGLGIEGFVDLSQRQTMFGFRVIAFFSGAYRGPKKNYNPHVRSENPR